MSNNIKKYEKIINELRYEKSLSIDDLQKKINSGRCKLLNSILEKTKLVNKNILDLGCGDGHASISIQKKFPELNITLLDHSANAIKVSKIHSEKFNLNNFEYYNEDFSYLFKKKFSFIFSNGSLHHSQSLNKFFETVSNNLVDGGFFYCQEPSFSELKTNDEIEKYYEEDEDILGVKIKRKNRNDNFFRVSDIIFHARANNFDLIENTTVHEWSIKNMNSQNRLKYKLKEMFNKKINNNYHVFKNKINLIENYFLFKFKKNNGNYFDNLY